MTPPNALLATSTRERIAPQAYAYALTFCRQHRPAAHFAALATQQLRATLLPRIGEVPYVYPRRVVDMPHTEHAWHIATGHAHGVALLLLPPLWHYGLEDYSRSVENANT